MELFTSVMVGNILFALLGPAVGFLIEKNCLGHVADCLGRVRSPAGGGLGIGLSLILQQENHHHIQLKFFSLGISQLRQF